MKYQVRDNVLPYVLDLTHVSERCKYLLSEQIRKIVRLERGSILEDIEFFQPGPVRDDMQRYADACQKVDDECNMFRRAVAIAEGTSNANEAADH